MHHRQVWSEQGEISPKYKPIGYQLRRGSCLIGWDGRKGGIVAKSVMFYWMEV